MNKDAIGKIHLLHSIQVKGGGERVYNTAEHLNIYKSIIVSVFFISWLSSISGYRSTPKLLLFFFFFALAPLKTYVNTTG